MKLCDLIPAGRLLPLPILLFALAGCGGDGTIPGLSVDNDDRDGDGLSDTRERELGTNPALYDTDGDGLSDGQEVLELGFDGSLNPLSYNPLVADLPELGIELVGTPDIGIEYTESSGTSSTSTAQIGGSTTTAITNSGTISLTLGTERSISAGLSDLGVSASYYAEITGSYTYTQSTTNQQTWSSIQSIRNDSSKTVTGGFLRTGVRLVNRGDVTFTLNSIGITALRATRDMRSPLEAVATLEFDASNGFPVISLAPDEKTEILTFVRTDLNLEDVKALLVDSTSLILRPSGLEQLVDIDGNAFAYNEAVVRRRSAEIIIDYGTERPVERYWVATNRSPDNPGTDLQTLLGDTLQIPVEKDASGLTGLRGVTAEDATDARWVVVRRRVTGDAEIIDRYDPARPDDAYDPATLVARAGDRFLLIYLKDADGDGLGMREELVYGTDPQKADSDDDGRSDYDEVYTRCYVNALREDDPYRYPTWVYSSPIFDDIDEDGLSDSEECLEEDMDNPGNTVQASSATATDPNEADTDGDGIRDDQDNQNTGADPTITLRLKLEAAGAMALRLSGSVGTGDGRYPETILIDWGDGSQDTLVAIDGSPSQRPIDLSHDYDQGGDYTVTVTATDNEGLSGSRSAAVRLEEVQKLADSFSYALGWRVGEQLRNVADVDGDGDADLFGISEQGVYVARAENGRFQTPRAWSREDGFTLTSWSDLGNYPRRLADLDGDGDLDLLVYGDTWLRYAENIGNRFAAGVDWIQEFTYGQDYRDGIHFRFLADVDGNGLPDPLAIGASAVVLALNNFPSIGAVNADDSNSFSTGGGLYSAFYPAFAAPLDGDNCADLLVFGNNTTFLARNACDGSGGFDDRQSLGAQFTAAQGWRLGMTPRLLSDVDGDGYPDIVGFGQSFVWVARNEGDGRFAQGQVWGDDFVLDRGWEIHKALPDPSCPGSDTTQYLDLHPRYLADVDGDGYPDIVGFGVAGVWVAFNRPHGESRRFEEKRLFSTAFDLATGDWNEPRIQPTTSSVDCRQQYLPRFTADIDGDGRADFVGFARDGVVYQLAPRIGEFQ